jgi:hypothetical protein
LRLGEQRVLRVWEGRPEHHRGGGSRGDPTIAELGGGAGGEFGIGESRLGREDALVEPFQQLPATVGIAGVRLGEVDVGVDEPGKQEPGSVIVHHRGGELLGYFGPVAAEHYSPAIIDHHGPIGNLRQRGGRTVDGGPPRDVEDVAVVNLGHRTMIAASQGFDAAADSSESAPTAQQTS